jgi:TM2 domain-containing membrane protein YozV
MSLEHRRPVASAGQPDLGFQAAFGFYLGLVAGGLVVVAGLLADLTAATLLGTFPTVVTAVTLAGHIAAKRSHGLPQRIGSRWRWRLACYLPAAAFAAAALVPAETALRSAARHPGVAALTLVLCVTAFGLERLCRKQYVVAITADEPAVTWTYQPVGVFSNPGLWMPVLAFTTMGLGASIATGSVTGLIWIVFGVLIAVWSWMLTIGDANGKKYYGTRFSLDVDAKAQQGELRAHERGVRHDQGRSSTLVPWEKISGIELTDDELVLERRFRTLRCDREAIDDPEAVYEALEELNSRVET